ncbi:MAG: phage head closure protein [Bacteroidales bacterium]|nr:phage head closure protein [Bacteroidales bacterium]
MKIDPGELRHRVAIQRKTVVRDTFGGETVSWTDVATAWMSLKPLSGRELYAAQQAHAETTHKAIMRYVAGITPNDRLKYGERIFDITSVLNHEEKSVYLIIEARENHELD